MFMTASTQRSVFTKRVEHNIYSYHFMLIAPEVHGRKCGCRSRAQSGNRPLPLRHPRSSDRSFSRNPWAPRAQGDGWHSCNNRGWRAYRFPILR